MEVHASAPALAAGEILDVVQRNWCAAGEPVNLCAPRCCSAHQMWLAEHRQQAVLEMRIVVAGLFVSAHAWFSCDESQEVASRVRGTPSAKLVLHLLCPSSQ